jgi:hypothetical protein
VHLYREVVVKALVKERQLERQLGAAPPCALGLETDVPVLIVGQLLQLLRQVDIRLLVRRRGELASEQCDVVEGERRACCGKQECGEREAGGAQRRDVAPRSG